MTDSLFEDLIYSPDRDRPAGSRPVLSYREDDEPEFLAAIDEHAVFRASLRRRGVDYGDWAEFDGRTLNISWAKSTALEVERRERWQDCRPLLLPGLLRAESRQLGKVLSTHEESHHQLQQPGGLEAWIRKRQTSLPEHMQSVPRQGPASDPERDLDIVGFQAKVLQQGQPVTLDDLWIKSARLSTYAEDASLRLRFSFGTEGDDDANADLTRNHAVAQLAAALCPEVHAIAQAKSLHAVLEPLARGPVYLTQPIAYWNAPEGGAAFHHDAFDEDPGQRQLGVAYVQWVGTTAWLALSIEDLARRVVEFLEYMLEGEMPWLVEPVFGSRKALEDLARQAEDATWLTRELAKPGTGCLAALTSQGPEFSSLLADAGHAFFLHPGDCIVLPNGGLGATCLHSVFCADQHLTYATSHGIRADRPRNKGGRRAQTSTPAPTHRSFKKKSGGRPRGRS